MRPLETKWQRKWIGLDVTHKLVQEAGSAAERFCMEWFDNITSKPVIIFAGESGCGKTHIIQAIQIFCMAAAMRAFTAGKWGTTQVPSIVYYSWPEICVEFNAKNYSAAEDAAAASLLILDDIGAENDPWGICKDKLCQILSRREFKFTAITTNIKPEAWSEKFDARIEDRLLRGSVIKSLFGVESYAVVSRSAK
jgi:DNA replication protein DnaC